MYNALVLGALFVLLLFDDLSGHSYPSTFLIFSIMQRCRVCICNSYSTVVGIYGSKPTRARGRSPEGKGGLRCHISLTTVL